MIGFAGGPREKKGLCPLLNAYAQVSKREPAILLIVGDVRTGEDKQIFEDFRLSNPDTTIVVTGFVSQHDLPVYYLLMDVFVQPSLRAGLPNALLEAMACEAAVIITPVGDILNAVIDCETGRFVRTNGASELSDTINELVADEVLRKKLGRAARQTIMDKFTLHGELNETLALHSRLGLKH